VQLCKSVSVEEKIVVDASAVLAVVMNEPEKTAIISATRGSILLAPGCLPWEVGNAFSAMLKRGRLAVEAALAGLGIFECIPIQESPVDLKAALRLAEKHNIYAYDAYYLELAIRGGMPLLTLDERMAAVGKTEGIKVKEII